MVGSVRNHSVRSISTCGILKSELVISPSFSKSRKMAVNLVLAVNSRASSFPSSFLGTRELVVKALIVTWVTGASGAMLPSKVFGDRLWKTSRNLLHIFVTASDASFWDLLVEETRIGCSGDCGVPTGFNSERSHGGRCAEKNRENFNILQNCSTGWEGRKADP